ncbi:sulfurtransferase [Sphingopyxis lindanitolerans]|uniref:Sulfurtransferase n=2 Tax=Sphingopyxis lindanitolerans TaxID=2054227 RepID=A0A2S8B8U8_9SPHN|nr:sulfurtransferase [Sphingopyxis lindanitolerans]
MTMISPLNVRRKFLLREEVALFDLRGEADYALAHPLFAASLPLGQLEARIGAILPRLDTAIIVYDDGEGYCDLAVERLESLGYSDVRVMAGGLDGWRSAGFELFQDVNSASKAFGELVEYRRHTPSIPAPEAKALIERNGKFVILDARRFDEYQNMNIPTGISVPGAELVLRARALAPDPATMIIVNCAGRTRSILGAQSLINAGLPNPVKALRNGTIGWLLAGQSLETGSERSFSEADSDFEAEARRAARDVAYRAGVKPIDRDALAALMEDPRRTTYRFDVRSLEEYLAGHPAGFLHAPGGQLVQETDVFAPVRGARIVLADNRGVRADMTGSWLAQMGWEVYVLDAALAGEIHHGPAPDLRPTPPSPPLMSATALAERADEVRIVDLSSSPRYRRGHIPHAAFAVRSRLLEISGKLVGRPIVFTSEDGYIARYAATELAAVNKGQIYALEGGNAAWVSEGRALAAGEDEMLVRADDVYRRPYEGTDNPESAMQAYLDWEYGLVTQLERDGTHGFFVV